MPLHIILNSNNIQPRIDRKSNEPYLVQVELDEDGISTIQEREFKPRKELWPIKQILLLPLANLQSYTAVIESEEGEWVKWKEDTAEWVKTRCPSE